MSKVWFITGASKGFGREWAEAALERGDRVAATARRPETLDAWWRRTATRCWRWRSTSPTATPALPPSAQAAAHFGSARRRRQQRGLRALRHDRGARGGRGARAARDQPLRRAVGHAGGAADHARPGSGHIIQVSSIGGISAFPMIGAYHASKWALEGFSQALAAEVAGFGIHVTLVEPVATRPTGAAPRPTRSEPNEAYAAVREARNASPAGTARRPQGHPRRDPQGRRCRPAAAAGLLRRGAARDRDARLRVAPAAVGRVAAARARGPRRLTSRPTSETGATFIAPCTRPRPASI